MSDFLNAMSDFLLNINQDPPEPSLRRDAQEELPIRNVGQPPSAAACQPRAAGPDVPSCGDRSSWSVATSRPSPPRGFPLLRRGRARGDPFIHAPVGVVGPPPHWPIPGGGPPSC